jgi:hypothetical protein
VVGLFIIGYVAKGGKIKKPIILWLPVEKKAPTVGQKDGIEFLSLEDIDL